MDPVLGVLGVTIDKCVKCHRNKRMPLKVVKQEMLPIPVDILAKI